MVLSILRPVSELFMQGVCNADLPLSLSLFLCAFPPFEHDAHVAGLQLQNVVFRFSFCELVKLVKG